MESPPDAGKETQPDEKTAVGPMDSSQKNAEKAVKLRTDPRERAKDFVNDSKEDAGQRMNGAAIKARIAGERAMAAARMLFSSVQEPPGNAGNAAVPDTVQADKAKKEPAPMRAEGVESRSQSEARPLRPELGVMSHGRTFERFDLDKTLSNAYDTSKAYGTVTEMAAFTHVNGRPVSLTHEGETLRFDRDQEGNTYASINGVRVEPLDAAKFLVKYDRATLGGAAILVSRLRLAARDPFQKGIPAPVKVQAPGKGKETEKRKSGKDIPHGKGGSGRKVMRASACIWSLPAIRGGYATGRGQASFMTGGTENYIGKYKKIYRNKHKNAIFSYSILDNFGVRYLSWMTKRNGKLEMPSLRNISPSASLS